MKNLMIIVVGLILAFSSGTVLTEEHREDPSNDATEAAATKAESQELEQIVVYYLHLNRRCATCGKLESYSKEAIDSGFAEQLTDSSIVFRVENFEQEGNEHFAKDYQLYSQSLILSRRHEGKETEWKNLDKIWQLVGNKEEFITYVQSEIENFVNTKKDE